MTFKRRILNWLIGFVCLAITIKHGINVYNEVTMNTTSPFPVYRLGSVLGWLFVTFCFFYIDAIGAIQEVIQTIKRAKRIRLIRKKNNQQR